MSTLIARFGQGTGPSNYHPSSSTPGPLLLPLSNLNDNYGTQPYSPTNSVFGHGNDENTNLAANPNPTDGLIQQSPESRYEDTMDVTGNNLGGIDMPNHGEATGHAASPTGSSYLLGSHQTSAVQASFNCGHSHSRSGEYSFSRSSTASPAPTLATGTRRFRGLEDGSFNQLRVGSTTHQLRAFATQITIDLKLSPLQSDELVKMAEVSACILF